MKNNKKIKDILILGVFASAAYYAVRRYNQKKEKEREMRETLYFHLF